MRGLAALLFVGAVVIALVVAPPDFGVIKGNVDQLAAPVAALRPAVKDATEQLPQTREELVGVEERVSDVVEKRGEQASEVLRSHLEQLGEKMTRMGAGREHFLSSEDEGKINARLAPLKTVATSVAGWLEKDYHFLAAHVPPMQESFDHAVANMTAMSAKVMQMPVPAHPAHKPVAPQPTPPGPQASNS